MEYIIKYTGELPDLGYPTELLDAQFAVMDLGEEDPMGLLEHRQVTCFEPARSLSGLEARTVPGGPGDYGSLEAVCVPQVRREYGLTGKGVLIGFVDSGLDLGHPEFLGEDGVSRVAALWDMTAQGTPPEGFRQGAFYSGEEIAAGHVPSGDRSGHGTAVAAIAGRRPAHRRDAGRQVPAGPGGGAGDALRRQSQLRHQLGLPLGADPVRVLY